MFDLTWLTILVVEDEFFLADEIASALSAVGAQVAGPAGSVAAAMKIVEAGTMLHAALLDVNLVGEKVFSVADSLLQRGTPFVFATGYDADVIPNGTVVRRGSPSLPLSSRLSVLSSQPRPKRRAQCVHRECPQATCCCMMRGVNCGGRRIRLHPIGLRLC